MTIWLFLAVCVPLSSAYLWLDRYAHKLRRLRLIARTNADQEQEAMRWAAFGSRGQLVRRVIADALGVPTDAVRLDDRFEVEYRLPLRQLIIEDDICIVSEQLYRLLPRTGRRSARTEFAAIRSVADVIPALERCGLTQEMATQHLNNSPADPQATEQRGH